MARKGEPEEEQHKLEHEARQQEAEELGENTFDCSAPSLRREQEAYSNVRVMEVGVAAEAEVVEPLVGGNQVAIVGLLVETVSHLATHWEP